MTTDPPAVSVRPGLLLAICCSSLFRVWVDAAIVTIRRPAIARPLHTRVAGPVIGGMLVGSAGWRGACWASIPPGLAAMGLAALSPAGSRAETARRADPAGQVLLIVTLASLCPAIIEGPGHGWRSPGICGLFALVGVTLAALAGCERRRAGPGADAGLFRGSAHPA